ncbi:MAG: chitinase [Chloroflexota bacterium]|jgi:hypothetical protein|nr:chitinase [Chloroflexota bacterium]
MKTTIKHGAILIGLPVMLATMAPGLPGLAAAPSASPNIERPSILQAQDTQHSHDVVNLPADTRQDGSFTRAQPRAALRGPLASEPRAYNNGGLTREVFGFATYWNLAAGDLSDMQYDKVSTIAYFGLTYTAPGTFDAGDGGATGWNSAALTDVVNRAHAAGDRVVVTVKTFNKSTIGSIINNPQNGQAAIDSAIAAVTSRGLDGVNVDFEGGDGTQQQAFTAWIASLSQQLHQRRPGSFLTVDSYSGSASWNDGFIRVDTMAPHVDAFFIMAYDMGLSNDPLGTLPNAPLAGPYTYQDTESVDQYIDKAGDRGKVILGVPYYGYKFSTTSRGFHAGLNTAAPGCYNACADPYSVIRDEFTCAPDLQLNWDAASSTPWASWFSPASNDPCGGNRNSLRELYYDDASSLSAKYDMVNNRDIRGVGIWALGYDHGFTDLWDAIANRLSCPPAPAYHANALAATQSSTKFTVSWAANAGSAAASLVRVWVRDGSGPWLKWVDAGGGGRSFYGFAGHAYSFYVQALGPCHSAPPPGTPQATTMIAANAGKANAYTGLYTLDGWGHVHGVQSPPLETTAYWPGWDIARSLSTQANGQGGYVLDGYGGVHAYGAANPTVQLSAYWSGWDIARDVATLSDGSGGYVLDGYGGVHPFATGGHAMPPGVPDSSHTYWQGWDIARKLVVFPDGSGGYTLDGYGGVHPFATAGHAMPAGASNRSHAYWQDWDIARSLVLVPGTLSGYVLDGWGGVHPFAPTGGTMPRAVADSSHAYWHGWDIANGLVLAPGSNASNPAGWTVDGWGGVHQFGAAPAVTVDAYWSGWDIARGISGQ